MLRTIPISKPGTSGISLHIARTDAEEAELRKSAAAQGLLAGTAMPTQKDSQFWSFRDWLDRH
jgi:hypothetical protein